MAVSSPATPSLDIAAPQIVLIAEGDSPASQANARGHVFEAFVARLFEAYGCDAPQKSTVNVRSNGYEVDIATRITLSREPAIAECKAFHSPLSSSVLNTFYGKLSTERLDSREVHGWFVAIPGLTSDGHQLARKLEDKDKRFRLITAHDIYQFAKEKCWFKPIDPPSGARISDHALLVSNSGLCSLAKQLDSETRLPVRVLAQRADGTVTESELALLSETNYVGGLPIQDCGAPFASKSAISSAEKPTIVSVVGSTGDFEYQFPAAPAYFVGREQLLSQIREIVEGPLDSGRVIVLNALSGWGKSSLALRAAAQVETAKGYAAVFDTRTASDASYVSAALRSAITAAQEKHILSVPADATFASLQSCLLTLQSCTWRSSAGPLMIFFDQFENVFRDARLTQEFRDLALAVREVHQPVIVGLSWKTDLVGFTERYPYRLRDEIRGSATVINVEPFGPTEVGIVLGRLAKAAGMPLSLDLRQRLREYSQGLPWLLKKLASHILKQLHSGTREETLLAESLNIEVLFQQDLASLQAAEVDALKIIAREAPVPVADVVERIEASVVQSLVDQRLLVRVGEKLDVYWDTFREFLLTGKVSVEDTYILRLRPMATAQVLQEIVRAGGEVPSNEVARVLSTSLNVVFNASRELRQLGVLAPRTGSLVLVEELRSDAAEERIQERVARTLRRHRVFNTVAGRLFGSPQSQITVDDLAKLLPAIFPAIEAKPSTWRTYAQAFASWLDYSGLVRLRGQVLCPPTAASNLRLLGGGEQGRQKTFPQTSPMAAMRFLTAKLNSAPASGMTESAVQKAENDLQVLGVLDDKGKIQDAEKAKALIAGDETSRFSLLCLLKTVPGGSEAISLLEQQPRSRSEDLGVVLRDAYGLPWVATTTKIAGTKFRAWAQSAGVKTLKVMRKRRENPQQPELGDTTSDR